MNSIIRLHIAWIAMLGCVGSAVAQDALDKRREEFLSWKFGMFLHFNLATFNNAEWCGGYEDPLTFAPAKLDCGNWFWQPGLETHIRSAEDIVAVLRKCNERRANYLLDVGPDRQGLIAEPFVRRLKEIGARLGVDGRPDE